ncbi:hypothetical protein CAEBREN_05063 [Caenorhabditis brenneri]|uniref:Uncharacterized protein n=1 Tax=Caenorhabditis brenneri TaxID=135651 RepID=G0N465_CAEBE|nr:hypothetical protein CAEBREN_05063 [Caenorhabditis brenneri]
MVNERSQSPDSSEFEVIEKEELKTLPSVQEEEKKEKIPEKEQEREGNGSDTITLKKEEYDGLLLRLAELEAENKKLKKIEEEEAALENDWGELNRDPKVAEQFREDWNAALILHGRNLQKREDEEERRKQEEYEQRESCYADQRRDYDSHWNHQPVYQYRYTSYSQRDRNQYDDRSSFRDRYSPQCDEEYQNDSRNRQTYDRSNYESDHSKYRETGRFNQDDSDYFNDQGMFMFYKHKVPSFRNANTHYFSKHEILDFHIKSLQETHDFSKTVTHRCLRMCLKKSFRITTRIFKTKTLKL